MPALAELRTTGLRALRTTLSVLDASFHPFRTVREGGQLVRDLFTVEPEEPLLPPTEAVAVADPAVEPAEPAERLVEPDPVAPVDDEDLADDRPVESRGPAPHVPPALAGEIERDYGDEIPGISQGDGR